MQFKSNQVSGVKPAQNSKIPFKQQILSCAFQGSDSKIVVAELVDSKLEISAIDLLDVKNRRERNFEILNKRELALPIGKNDRSKPDVHIGRGGRLMSVRFKGAKAGEGINTIINLEERPKDFVGIWPQSWEGIGFTKWTVCESKRLIVRSNDTLPPENTTHSTPVDIEIYELRSDRNAPEKVHQISLLRLTSKNGQKILSSRPICISDDGSMILFPDCIRNTSGGETVLKDIEAGVPSRFSPSCKRLATIVGNENVILELDFHLQKIDKKPVRLRTEIYRKEDQVHLFAFLPDGSRVFTVSEDGTIRIWQADREAKPIVLRENFSNAKSLDVSHDGRFLICANDKEIAIFDAGQSFVCEPERE